MGKTVMESTLELATRAALASNEDAQVAAVASVIARIMAEARAEGAREEREACAQVAYAKLAEWFAGSTLALAIYGGETAAAIRARGESRDG